MITTNERILQLENELIIFKEKVKDYADFVDKNIGWEYGFSMDEYKEKRERLGL